jgi:hypothetical protein
VRKLISKFRKISQESRTASQSAPTAPISFTTLINQAQTQAPLMPLIPKTTIQPASAEPIEEPSTSSSTVSSSSIVQLLQLPMLSTNKGRDKLETISERIETQDSQVSQITSVNQSPPLHRPPKSSKWKWLKTGSTEPESDSSPKPAGNASKPLPPVAPQPQQQMTNPFDPNLSDDEAPGKSMTSSDRRPSIPLSLFIPRSAQRGIVKTTDESIEQQVSDIDVITNVNSLVENNGTD